MAICPHCGCDHVASPYAENTPEYRTWAKAQEHGKAAAAREGYQDAPDLDGDYSENQLLSDAGWVPHDGTDLRDDLIAQYRNDAAAAFHDEAERRFRLADILDDRMDPDHVIKIAADGSVTDAQGSYAPELVMFTDEDGQALPDSDEQLREQAKSAGWRLLEGWTGQHAYDGPVMHPSEYVGGRLAEHIIATPGEYVAVVVEALGEGGDDDDSDQPAGWAVAYREA